ncbi:DNA-binding transcriptional regulator, LysR family [Roseospirillum parvum]|uniref:HTH-type transcriptional regulator CbbR n=1 Tax=Roseospirillum parvum TaxID=83401 RepID=A0A1G7US18_9PROT|nr:DNA-binding transcriptional regulator, LysR family [Roseospirillum parvum]
MHATLQQLRLFEAVARLGSVTRAAAEVHLTQPAVSIQVKRLEAQVGMPLLESVGRTLRPTPAGHEVLAAGRDILGRMESLEAALDGLRGDVAGPLRVAAVTTAKYFMPHLMGAFLKRHPKVRPVLSVINRANLLERLAGQQDDLFITGRVPGALPVAADPFLDNVIVPVARPDHRLVGRAQVPMAELAAERILKRELGSGTRSAVEQAFEAEGLRPPPFMELGSDEAIKQAVMAGLGIACLSTHCIAAEVAAGRLVALDVAGFPLVRQWFAVRRAGRALPGTASAFLDFLRDEGAAVLGGKARPPA